MMPQCTEIRFYWRMSLTILRPEKCDKAVRNDHFSVWFVPDWFVPDWFVAQQQRKYLRVNNNDWSYNELIEWNDGFKAGKAQKASIKASINC